MSVHLEILQIPAKVSLSGNTAVVSARMTYIDSPTNIIVHCKLTMYPNGVEGNSIESSAYPDANGRVAFEIESLFVNERTEFVFPEHETNLVVPRARLCTRYKVDLWVSYTDENGVFVSSDAEKAITDLYYLPGGISLDHEADLNDANTDWWTEYKESKRWLNWLPGEKLTSLTALEKLYYVAEEDVEEALTIEIVKIDGTEDTFQYLFPAVAYMGYELCVSPALVRKLFPGEKIRSYRISLNNERSQSYRINLDYVFNEVHFLTENPYLVFESVVCVGPGSAQKIFGKTLYDIVLPHRIGVLDHGGIYSRDENSNKNTASTGYLESSEWAEWYAEILAGGHKYKYTPDHIVPVVISSDAANVNAQPVFKPYAIGFEWDFARKSRFSSKYKIPTRFVMPPYLNRVQAFYYRIFENQIIDKMGGPSIPINDGWWYVSASGLDVFGVFDVYDTDYWSSDLNTSEFSGVGGTLNAAFFTAANLFTYATPKRTVGFITEIIKTATRARYCLLLFMMKKD